MAELGNFFVTIGSKFDAKGLEKARDSINKVALAGAAMAGALTIAGAKAAKAAGVQEQAELLLAQAMKQAGTFTEKSFKANLEYASSLQKVSTFGDEVILVVQRQLTNFGLEGEALRDATKATIDLAAAKGFDLKVAGDLVAKSIGSSTNALTRYGIEVQGAAGSTERAQSAVQNISKLFGGAAQAKADTYLGRIDQLNNQWGDFVEDIGFAVIPAITDLIKLIQTSVLPIFESWIDDTKNVSKITDTLKFTIQTVTKTIIGFIGAINLAGSAMAIFALALTGNLRAAKIGFDELKEKVISLGETIKKVDQEEIESDQEKKDVMLEAEIANTEARQELKDQVAESDQNRLTAMEEIEKGMAERKKQRQEDLAANAEELARRESEFIIGAAKSVADLQVITAKSVTQALKESFKQRLSAFVESQMQELIAAKIKSLAIAISNSTVTFGAAAGQIGVILAQFAGATAALRGIQSFDTGGVVQGRLGKPVLVQALGGERFLGRQSIGKSDGNVIVNVNKPITTRNEARILGNIVGEEIFKKVNRQRRI